MTAESELTLQLDSALDRLLVGDAIVAVEEDMPRELIPFVEAFAALLDLTRQPARPEFRQALRSRLVAEPGAARSEQGTALLGRVAALVAATFLVGSAINPVLARNLVQSVSNTMGHEIAQVVQEVLTDGGPTEAAPETLEASYVAPQPSNGLPLTALDSSAIPALEEAAEGLELPAGSASDAETDNTTPSLRQSEPPQSPAKDTLPAPEPPPGSDTARPSSVPAPAEPLLPAPGLATNAETPGATVPADTTVQVDSPPTLAVGPTDAGGETTDEPSESGAEDGVTDTGGGTSEPTHPGQGANPPGNAGSEHRNHPPTSNGADPPGKQGSAGGQAPTPGKPTGVVAAGGGGAVELPAPVAEAARAAVARNTSTGRPIRENT